MKKLLIIFLLSPLLFSCEKILFEEELQTDDPYANFDYLWKECDRKYSYFEYKNIDWTAIREKYRPRLYHTMSNDSLFDVMGEMMKELRDDHANLISDFNRSRYGVYRKGKDNFDWRVILDHYLPNDYYTSGPFRHDFIAGDSIAYVRLSAFSGGVSSKNLNFIMNRYKDSKGIIFDIRENGGGSISYAFRILERFVNKKTLLYYSRIKDGPGHGDFSSLEPCIIEPSEGRNYHKKVILLIDRGSYSASSFMALSAKAVDNVTLMGDTTGGGLGMPNGGQLPNGWTYRFSVTQTLDPDGNNYESGVPPDIQASFNWNNLNTDEVIERAIQEINIPSL